MSDKEILEKAIQKAIDGGWTRLGSKRVLFYRNYSKKLNEIKLQVNDDGMVGSEYFNVEAIIFNHQFAKALWGEVTHTDKLWIKLDNPTPEGREYLLNVMPAYEYHLKQMVVSSDPIKYLGEHLDGK